MIGTRRGRNAHSIAMIPSEDDDERHQRLAKHAQTKGDQQYPQ
jgi:hypothetical protein